MELHNKAGGVLCTAQCGRSSCRPRLVLLAPRVTIELRSPAVALLRQLTAPMEDVERVDLDDTSREVIQRCASPPISRVVATMLSLFLALGLGSGCAFESNRAKPS